MSSDSSILQASDLIHTLNYANILSICVIRLSTVETNVNSILSREITMPIRQPNLIFVFPDQMRGSAMGFLGREPVHTPRLDAFAAESLVLTQAAVAYPVCSFYRAMFMTGQYPHRNGVLDNCNNKTEP